MGCSHSYLPPQTAILHLRAAAASFTSQASGLKIIRGNILLVFICSLQFEQTAFLICAHIVGSSQRNDVKMQRTSTAQWGQFMMAEDLTRTASLISLLLNLYSKCFAIRGLSYEIVIPFWLSAKVGLKDGNTLMLQVISSAAFNCQSQLSDYPGNKKCFQIYSLLMH